jgi:hypothetical protein
MLPCHIHPTAPEKRSVSSYYTNFRECFPDCLGRSIYAAIVDKINVQAMAKWEILLQEQVETLQRVWLSIVTGNQNGDAVGHI